ncbi:MAG: LysR family transcriptional regulator [Candidatus Sulfotelmatobacter sp.]|jgi:LysR family transcriptional regulator, low CO2-responsive transcriptional regulator
MVNLTFKQLEAVYEVSRSRTIIKAAEVLHVTPAALTSRIKLLENDLGLALFDRTGNRLRLTDAGREAAAAAARIQRGISDLADTLESMKGLHGGRVRFGAVSTAKYYAPHLIAAFLRDHSRVDLNLVVGNRAETVESLRNYDIDIALMGRPPADFGAVSQPFGPHPYVMISSRDHPLARRKLISKAEIAKEKFIVREPGSGTRNIFEYFFNAQLLPPPKVMIEMGSNETIKQAVMAGLGISLISAHTTAAEIESGRVVGLKIEGLPIVRQWFVVRRSDRDLPPAGRALWNFIATKGSTFLPSPALSQRQSHRRK